MIKAVVPACGPLMCGVLIELCLMFRTLVQKQSGIQNLDSRCMHEIVMQNNNRTLPQLLQKGCMHLPHESRYGPMSELGGAKFEPAVDPPP